MPARKKGSESGAGRIPVTIGLRPQTNAVVNRWLDLNGGWGKAKFIEMLVERFASMPESVQQVMLGIVPADMRMAFAKKSGEFFEAVARGEAWISSPAPQPESAQGAPSASGAGLELVELSPGDPTPPEELTQLKSGEFEAPPPPAQKPKRKKGSKSKKGNNHQETANS